MQEQATVTKKSMNVLLIGNNPIELSAIYDQLKDTDTIHYIPEIAFDIDFIEKRIKSFRPDCIVIDDNLDKSELQKLLNDLGSRESTSGIPITIIQNSNADDTPRDGADEFLLKNMLSPERISRAISNSLKIHEMRSYLKKAYQNRKRILSFK